MNVQIITPAANTVLDLADVKLFLRVEIDADDTVIAQMILAAERSCEKYIRRYLLPTALGLWFDLGQLCKDIQPDGTIHTPGGKLLSVTKIATYDLAGGEIVVPVEDYLVDSVSEQEGRIHFLTSHDGERQLNSLLIQTSTGYADSVPDTLIHGMNMLIAHWYENREAYEKGSTPLTIRNLWQSERIMRVG